MRLTADTVVSGRRIEIVSKAQSGVSYDTVKRGFLCLLNARVISNAYGLERGPAARDGSRITPI